nr:hypothetical protein [Candidatus Sigynarchaeota archaeon]
MITHEVTAPAVKCHVCGRTPDGFSKEFGLDTLEVRIGARKKELEIAARKALMKPRERVKRLLEAVETYPDMSIKQIVADMPTSRQTMPLIDEVLEFIKERQERAKPSYERKRRQKTSFSEPELLTVKDIKDFLETLYLNPEKAYKYVNFDYVRGEYKTRDDYTRWVFLRRQQKHREPLGGFSRHVHEVTTGINEVRVWVSDGEYKPFLDFKNIIDEVDVVQFRAYVYLCPICEGLFRKSVSDES